MEGRDEVEWKGRDEREWKGRDEVEWEKKRWKRMEGAG